MNEWANIYYAEEKAESDVFRKRVRYELIYIEVLIFTQIMNIYFFNFQNFSSSSILK